MSAPGEVSQQVRITNAYGLHARPAAQFVKLASRFQSEIWVRKLDLEVNGKSIMGMMMLAAECGSGHHHSCRWAAMPLKRCASWSQLVANKFDEE